MSIGCACSSMFMSTGESSDAPTLQMVEDIQKHISCTLYTTGGSEPRRTQCTSNGFVEFPLESSLIQFIENVPQFHLGHCMPGLANVL